jgi:hypothetical protein
MRYFGSLYLIIIAINLFVGCEKESLKTTNRSTPTNSFCKKQVDALGIQILSSSKVPDAAFDPQSTAVNENITMESQRFTILF